MRIAKTTLALTLLSTAITAQASNLTDSLLNCDSQFFTTLYQQKSHLQRQAPLVTDSQQHAWFRVPAGKIETVWFGQPLREHQLTLAGYYQQFSDLSAASLGHYYYWGFIINETPQAVMQQLGHLAWQKAGDDYIARPMIKRPGGESWEQNDSAVSGIAPAKGSVERLILLSQSEGHSRLLCSVQGQVTPDLLNTLRPDLTK